MQIGCRELNGLPGGTKQDAKGDLPAIMLTSTSLGCAVPGRSLSERRRSLQVFCWLHYTRLIGTGHKSGTRTSY